tara:strand:+ start:470 stop:628 length:159 start_codon:yes stop_codon:yes gene_type:complete
MSLLSRYINKQVKKKGMEAVVIWFLEMVARATKSKKDDAIVAKIKAFMQELK